MLYFLVSNVETPAYVFRHLRGYSKSRFGSIPDKRVLFPAKICPGASTDVFRDSHGSSSNILHLCELSFTWAVSMSWEDIAGSYLPACYVPTKFVGGRRGSWMRRRLVSIVDVGKNRRATQFPCRFRARTTTWKRARFSAATTTASSLTAPKPSGLIQIREEHRRFLRPFAKGSSKPSQPPRCGKARRPRSTISNTSFSFPFPTDTDEYLVYRQWIAGFGAFFATVTCCHNLWGGDVFGSICGNASMLTVL